MQSDAISAAEKQQPRVIYLPNKREYSRVSTIDFRPFSVLCILVTLVLLYEVCFSFKWSGIDAGAQTMF